MSSSNLLKGFGAGADVIGQLATDKAMRRKSTGVIRGFDMTDGELVEDVKLVGQGDPAAEPSLIQHSLGRVPAGALILKTTPNTATRITNTSLQNVEIYGALDTVVTLWIV